MIIPQNNNNDDDTNYHDDNDDDDNDDDVRCTQHPVYVTQRRREQEIKNL